MDKNANRMLNVEDFEQDDFDNPIKLLEALSAKQIESPCQQINLDNHIRVDEDADVAITYTIAEISKHYEVPVSTIRSAVESGALKISAYIPLISTEAAEVFIAEQNENLLFSSFMYEVQNMRTSYSYKPVLLLALLQKSNESGKSNINDIVDYFVGFYKTRKSEGLIVEKSDSTFVKNPADYTKAKITIIRYPVAVFADKKFLTYNKGTGIVTVSPLIWGNLTWEIKRNVTLNCVQVLKKYYTNL
jgi:hypothetical protein